MNYRAPDVNVLDRGEFPDALAPSAELSYCFEDLDVVDGGSQINISLCVDQGRFPAFDGSGNDQVEMTVLDENSAYVDSSNFGYGGGTVNGMWCMSYFFTVVPGQYTVIIGLIVDDERVCEEERIVTVTAVP